MSFNEATPCVSVKKRNINSLIDFCVENKIDFTVKSKSNDDFEVEFQINDTKKAIALGMCLKELKLELKGLQITSVSAIKATKKAAVKESVSLNENVFDTNNESSLAFENALQFELGASN